MHRSTPVLSALVALAASIAPVLAQSDEPTPGPEVAKLAAFVGTWKGEAQVKATPFGRPGKMAWTETCEWFEGGFQVVCKSASDTPWGKLQVLKILGWDAESSSYTEYNIDSSGYSNLAEGSVQDGTWTWGSERSLAGHIVRTRTILQRPTPTTTTFKIEMQREGGAWIVVSEGRSEKTT